MTDVDFRKRFYWTAVSVGAVLMVVALAFVKGLIPPRLVAWVFIAVAVAGYVAFYGLLKRASDERRATGGFDKPPDDPTCLRIRRIIRRLKIGVAFFVCGTVYTLWLTRGDPLAPRIAGASVNILITIYLVWKIRRLQRQLK